MDEYTEWYGKDIKPARVGVYEVKVSQQQPLQRWFSYWTGDFWGFTSQTPFAANLYRWLPSDEAQRQGGFEWRGLAEKAE